MDQYPRNHANVKKFCILDFDRTLVRTDDLRELYEGIIETLTPVTVAQIHEERDRVKSNFDVSRYVRERLEKELPQSEIDKTMVMIRGTFIRKARTQDFLEPYAAELLEYLRACDLPFGILTSGGREWQQTKIEAARLETIPHLIIATTKKGPLIASWQQPGGAFLLPDKLSGGRDVITDSLVFLDDKTISFQGIPSSVKGVRIISATAKEPFEPELPLPPNVKEVRGLQQAANLLFNL